MKASSIRLRARQIAAAEGVDKAAQFLIDQLGATKTLRLPGGKTLVVPDGRRRMAVIRAVMPPPRRRRVINGTPA